MTSVLASHPQVGKQEVSLSKARLYQRLTSAYYKVWVSRECRQVESQGQCDAESHANHNLAYRLPYSKARSRAQASKICRDYEPGLGARAGSCHKGREAACSPAGQLEGSGSPLTGKGRQQAGKARHS